MRKSGYRSIFHIYLIFFLALSGTILAAWIIFLMLVTVQKPDGETERSSWPKFFTESLSEQILWIDGKPQVSQSGLEQLRKNHAGVQILDHEGNEIYAFQKPGSAGSFYSNTDLLHLDQTGDSEGGKMTSFVGETAFQGKNYAYVVHFPMEIRTVTMYLNGERFTEGKAFILAVAGVLFLTVTAAAMIYGLWTAKLIKCLASSVSDISGRRYLPLKKRGIFGDLCESLNRLDTEIRAGDRLREETETIRREWIANVTHDLKTPLSPIKGYAELLQADSDQNRDTCRQYAGVMLKNAVYMENLIDDLKVTYQLENGMLPVRKKEQNFVRFLRELVIDVLNRPEYEGRNIRFDSAENIPALSFDERLITRAFQNLIINAFVHGDETTEITVKISASDKEIRTSISDNGKGMTAAETERLFERYYRGSAAGDHAGGTGLGLAIAKCMTELHGGAISVSSSPGLGTSFLVILPLV